MPDDIVVLTPYLGQLALVQSKLRHEQVAADISDMDMGDLTRNDLKLEQDSSTKGGCGTSVRVATIDNYQGEESKIIIASLVRSNVNGAIGFLSGPERVNVLCSRARDGFIMLGNANCFRNASSQRGRTLWNGILDRLQGTVH
jgi:superfamily I DNA and/or RNA helicase